MAGNKPRLPSYSLEMLTRSRSRSLSTEGTPAEDDRQSSYSQSDSAPKEELVVKKKKKEAKPRGRGFKRKPDQWVCVMPEAFQTTQENPPSISIVALKHPGSSLVAKIIKHRAMTIDHFFPRRLLLKVSAERGCI